MRKLTVALAIALLAGTSVAGVAPKSVAAAASYQAKVVIVVGAVQGTTSSYRSDADAEAVEFLKYTSDVTKIYSPNATWSAVSAAAKGANILVYIGHGSGYPNPYLSYWQPNGDSGMGLNASAGNGDSNLKYYGENYMAQLGLAPNAVVFLNHLCYASGDSEPGHGNPSLADAKTRVEYYASGFIRAGAKAVIAEGLYSINDMVAGLFTSPAATTIDSIWRSGFSYHNNVSSWASGRNAGYTASIDPGPPASDGDIYYRSMVSIPTTQVGATRTSTVAPFASASGSYYPLTPITRVVDTRYSSPGPYARLTSGGASTFQITGGNIPANAIAVTANLTVTGQQTYGWLAVGPNLRTTPSVSSINFPGGDNRANGITVPLSPEGTVDVYYGGPPGMWTDFIIDVTGYFLPGSDGNGYVQFGPQRMVDTRTDGTGSLVSATPRKIPLAGKLGLPASGIVAVAGNVTVVSPTSIGFVFVGPTAAAAPTSSTINFPRSDIRANNFIVPVAPDGSITAVYASPTGGQTVDLVIDISGYYVAGSGALYHTLNPTRILDTRPDQGPIGLSSIFSTGAPQTLTVAGAGGVPSGALAITANMTATQQTSYGHASIGPVVSASSVFSNLNFVYGDNRANGVISPLTADGKLQLLFVGTPGSTVHFVLDVCGYYQ